jgi:hypothetical protein
MSAFSHADAVDFFATIFGGVHHIPGPKHGRDNVREWGEGWYVINSGDLATFDGDVLTRLVILAHDRLVRVSVSSAGMRQRIEIHQRTARTGSVWDRHPTIETAIENWRKYAGAPKC